MANSSKWGSPRSACRQSTAFAVDCLHPFMGAPESYQNRMELLQGTLYMLVLEALQRGPIKGYGIAQSIRLKSAEMLEVETGSRYPAPRRHKRHRRVKLEWKTTESKQRAKFCQITAKGKQ